MKIELTKDSPILIKLIPETPFEEFKNNNIFNILNRSNNKKVKLKKSNILLINIDQCGWTDFKEH